MSLVLNECSWLCLITDHNFVSANFFRVKGIPGPNLDTEMMVEFSVAFYCPIPHIYYLSLYWPDLKVHLNDKCFFLLK